MKKKSLKRRQFLANLLFAGGMLSVGGLQAASAEKPDPKDEGWELPKDWKKSPEPKPTETPPPPPPGKPVPPNPRGARKPPQLKGDVAPPTAGFLFLRTALRRNDDGNRPRRPGDKTHMSDSKADTSIWQKSIKRRQFLANLLFTGGAISVVGLQASSAQSKKPEDDGWELPDDLLEPTDPPKRPPPRPQPKGRRVPPRPDPQPDGGIRIPQPPGGMRPPVSLGEAVAPPPKPPQRRK